jgi:threonyl-tRNA synthetase
MVCRPDKENDPLEKIRHSAAHVMADAVQSLFPETKVTIGPVIEEGFYYDFERKEPFTPEDLEKIEQKMSQIVEQNLPFEREEITRQDATQLFTKKREAYKIEILSGLDNDTPITLYRHGDWADLCKGPHAKSTGDIKAFKLLSVAGAYWRGDEKNPMLQRIYGTAFLSQKDLNEFLELRKEAESRDHRRIGKELGLFSTLEEDGAGLVLWHPKGARIRNIIENYWRETHIKGGYDLVYTPHLARRDLWRVSGHLDYYQDSMFSPMQVDEVDYQLRPMNCPFHIKIYKTDLRSYRDLPLRWAELGTVYRYERSGVLHGLFRVRGFTQDDAHIFCTPEQLRNEIQEVLNFTVSMLATFGFEDYEIFLSTRPEKSVGSDEHWELATNALKEALEQKELSYEIDPGEGVFYGPKIDIKIRDVLGRKWQCSTIQVDFNLPERFEADYVAQDGKRHRAIMIHRALLGSLERFFGVLIEHYAGAFPVWLAPVQLKLITITDKQADYAQKLLKAFKSAGVRVEWDSRSEKLGAKIRDAEVEKVPYMAILGKKEVEAKTISLRSKKEGDMGSMAFDKALETIHASIDSKH